jgi:predicted SAM-dependent methyltransferase
MEGLGRQHRVLRPSGRILVALVNVRTRAASIAMHEWAKRFGEPAHWPTRRDMREKVESAGFTVLRQERILRVAGLLVPTFLTVGEKRA